MTHFISVYKPRGSFSSNNLSSNDLMESFRQEIRTLKKRLESETKSTLEFKSLVTKLTSQADLANQHEEEMQALLDKAAEQIKKLDQQNSEHIKQKEELDKKLTNLNNNNSSIIAEVLMFLKILFSKRYLRK